MGYGWSGGYDMVGGGKKVYELRNRIASAIFFIKFMPEEIRGHFFPSEGSNRTTEAFTDK